MNSNQFYFLCSGYVIIVLVLEGRHVRSNTSGPNNNSSHDCDAILREQHVQNFYMKMGLCRRNISVVCFARRMHPCFKNVTNFRTTAFSQDQLGQCLIESNATKRNTLQFYITTKRIINPNEEGSRSLNGGGERERHQKGKCLLKYYCHKGALIHIKMDCGTLYMLDGDRYYNLTKRKRIWKAPPNFNDFVYFTSKVDVSKSMREVDVTSVRIFGKGTEDDDLDPEIEKEIMESLSSGSSAKPTEGKAKGKN